MDAGVGLNFLVNVFGCVVERAKGASVSAGEGDKRGASCRAVDVADERPRACTKQD